MEYAVFAVRNRPFCLWDWELSSRNLKFLKGIDYRYFAYVAKVHAHHLESDDKQEAAIALRAAYHHGVETLFTLIGAGLQAPFCVAGWVLKCRNADLRGFVSDIRTGARLINFAGLDTLTWEGAAEHLLQANFPDVDTAARIRARFASLWKRLSVEFSAESGNAEYNSIKHGFRARPGGFSLGVAPRSPDGGPPAASDFLPLGSSEFGSSFYQAKRIENAPNVKPDPHFQMTSYSVNWNPHGMVAALELIAISIQNIVCGLRRRAGEEAATVPAFLSPNDEQAFGLPWAEARGITSLHRDEHIKEGQIDRFTPAELTNIMTDKLRRPAP